MLKWIDLPPVWLLGCIGLAWAQPRVLDAGLSFGGAWADFAGGILIGGGVLLMLLAFYEMRRHSEADRMVTTGIFSRTRNPIYLGDALVLAGVILALDAPLALPLVPVFVWIIERRFVIPEENRLRRRFRADFARYCQKARRWL